MTIARIENHVSRHKLFVALFCPGVGLNVFIMI